MNILHYQFTKLNDVSGNVSQNTRVNSKNMLRNSKKMLSALNIGLQFTWPKTSPPPPVRTKGENKNVTLNTAFNPISLQISI